MGSQLDQVIFLIYSYSFLREFFYILNTSRFNNKSPLIYFKHSVYYSLVLLNLLQVFFMNLKVVTNEKGEAVGEVLTIIC